MIRLKKMPKKIKVYPSIQYHVFLVNMHYTLHWLSRLVTKSFVFEMSLAFISQLQEERLTRSTSQGKGLVFSC